MSKERIVDKKRKHAHSYNEFIKWLYTMRCALIDNNGADERVIISQFKDKLKNTNNPFFKAPRMAHYVNVAMDRKLQ